MSIDDKTIDKVADLAMLNPSEDQKTKLKGELNKIITMMGKLQELDTTGYEQCTQVNDHPQKLRKDQRSSELTRDAALSNCKNSQEGYFLVPKVIKK